MLEKIKSHAFGKDCYLLGEDKNGILYWLESASWDCGWYWGFGYIETYTSNQYPEKSRDIETHQHWNHFITGKQEVYNRNKKCWQLSSDYIHHINEHPEFVNTTLTDKESWKLAELMERFYTLRESAELFGRGGAHISGVDENLKRPEFVKNINEIILPDLFEQIYALLSPKGV